MWFLVGWLLGGKRSGGSIWRPLGMLALWPAIYHLAGAVVAANVSVAAAHWADVGVSLPLLVYALRRPASSGLKLFLIDGLKIWCKLAGMAGILLLVFVVLKSGLVISEMGDGLPCLLLIAVGAFGDAGLDAWVERDARRNGARLRGPESSPPAMPLPSTAPPHVSA